MIVGFGDEPGPRLAVLIANGGEGEASAVAAP